MRPDRREALRPLACLALLVLQACGGRTGLDQGPRPSPGELVPDVCVELPSRRPPEFVQVSFTPRVEVADVLILVDTTSSMHGTLEVLQYAIREYLLPDLLANVPDLRLGVASFEDFDWFDRGIRPFYLDQNMTTNRRRLETALDGLSADASSGDGPESQIEALYQVATGAGHRGAHVPRAHCPRDTIGYPCFRPSGARLILLFTDDFFHNGPAGVRSYPAGRFTPEPASYAQTVVALNGIGAKVIGLYAGGPERAGALEDLRGVARDTGTVTTEGEPLVFEIGRGAGGLREGVSESIRRVVQEVPIDVDLLLEPVSEGFDPALFVSAVRAVDASPADGARVEADSFRGVRPGTRVRFRLELQNESIPRTAADQRFYLRAVLIGDHAIRLQETLIELIVPGLEGPGCDGTTVLDASVP